MIEKARCPRCGNHTLVFEAKHWPGKSYSTVRVGTNICTCGASYWHEFPFEGDEINKVDNLEFRACVYQNSKIVRVAAPFDTGRLWVYEFGFVTDDNNLGPVVAEWDDPDQIPEEFLAAARGPIDLVA